MYHVSACVHHASLKIYAARQPATMRTVEINKTANKSRANECCCILFGTVANAATARDEYMYTTYRYTHLYLHKIYVFGIARRKTAEEECAGYTGYTGGDHSGRRQNKTNRNTHMNHLCGRQHSKPDRFVAEKKTKTNRIKETVMVLKMSLIQSRNVLSIFLVRISRHAQLKSSLRSN